MKKILIVEDDPAIRMALVDDFSYEGYQVESAANGPAGLAMGLTSQFDVIILDLMLPGGMDGLDICKELRKREIETPIIMLTAKSQDYDKVIGLELGADDYVTKPYSPHELRARVKAVLRRSLNGGGKNQKQVITAGPVSVDIARHECRLGGELVFMTTLELAILTLLASRPGELISREEILEKAWDGDVVVSLRTIDTHIGHIRKKICTQEFRENYIQSIRGLGYKLIVKKT